MPIPSHSRPPPLPALCFSYTAYKTQPDLGSNRHFHALKMVTVTIVNDTQVPLHISLRHISPIHFRNNIRPGSSAVFENVGRVWFTIEARIARGGTDDNKYTLVESLAAPIGVSLCVLSLGAGAVWLAGSVGAAGGVTAAVTSISSRIGATAAAQAPTARRLYRYAKQGQSIVSVGQVLGLGGGALLGKKAAEAQHQSVDSEVQRKQKGNKSWFAWDENTRVKEAKKVLKGLLEGSVVSSAGWYMNGERTIRIKGGPRASEIGDVLVIETDTLEAFEVVSDDTNDEDGKAAFGDGTGAKSIKTWWSSTSRQQKKGKGMVGKNEVTDSQSSFSGLEALKEGPAAEAKEETTYEKHQRQLYEKLSESSQWVFARIRRGPSDPPPIEDDDDDEVDEKLATLVPIDERKGTQSPAPPPDDDPAHPPTLETILAEMGFNDEQITQAKAKVGELPSDLEAEERRTKLEEAMLLLLNQEKIEAAEANSSVATTIEAPVVATDPDKPMPQVVGAEKVTTPHWTSKAKAAIEDSGAVKILSLGGSHLVDRGEKWLQKK